MSRNWRSRGTKGPPIRNPKLQEKTMEKYGVQVDRDKIPKKKDGEKTAGVDDPNVNVPKDPAKGTEPFEKKPDDAK